MKKVGKGFVFAIGFFVVGMVAFNLMREKTENTIVASHNVIISGFVETNETDVNVKVPGRLVDILVEEGDSVTKGQIIANIEAENLIAKVNQAKALLEIAGTRVAQSKIAYDAQIEQSVSQIGQASAVLDAAKQQLAKAKGGARPQQLQQTKELVTQAKEGYDYTKTTYDRLEKLYKEGVIPQQKIDGAKAELEVSKAKYNTALQQLDLVKEGAQKEDINSAMALVAQAQSTVSLANVTKLQVNAKAQDMEAAKAQYIQAQAGLAEIMSYLNDSTIKAPVDGVITLRNADNGELVSTGTPIVTIANLSQIWANIKVKETEIVNFKIGQIIDVIIPGDNNAVYKGKVTSISSKASYATVQATQNKDEKDLVSFAVKIKLENKDLRIKPGMTATIKLNNNDKK